LPQLYYRDNIAILLNRFSQSEGITEVMQSLQEGSNSQVPWNFMLNVMTHSLLDTLYPFILSFYPLTSFSFYTYKEYSP